MKKRITTRLGRAVRASVDGGKGTPAPAREQSSTTNSLRDVILGGQDGLVNMLGIALGVVAAGGSTHVLVVAGIAASITESISMGAVAYTSFGSDRDFYLAMKGREQHDISSRPEEEREEIREIYAAKGFGGRLLDDVVSTITSNRETWVSTMMDEELHLQPVEQRSLVSAVVVTVATLVLELIAVLAFTFDGRRSVLRAVWKLLSCVLTASSTLTAISR